MESVKRDAGRKLSFFNFWHGPARLAPACHRLALAGRLRSIAGRFHGLHGFISEPQDAKDAKGFLLVLY